MSLAPGTKLGPYEIHSPLGSGGMGEVYRARDMRLDRTVAIKILPAHLSSDPVRKQRFEREARTISSLNHPHICVVHDIGRQDGIDYLVMECVEGETLAKRLEKGPLPLEQVLKYGAQVAEALGKAHRNGVVHRDLKPGNIMLTSTGAKLLDFGLAKPAAALANAATLTTASAKDPVTTEGAIVGTFQYMSPEQVEGKDVDGRSDIFSLGTTLYEMVTGKRAFVGESQLSVSSAILEKEPPPISAIKPMTPTTLDHAIRRCLAKDPEERWQSAGDLAGELKWIGEAGSQAAGAFPAGPSRHRGRLAWIVAAAALALSAALAAWPLLHRESQRSLMTSLLPPAKVRLVFGGRNGPPVISPDGATVAFLANDGGTQSIWIRKLDAVAPTRLPGTEDAFYPFWSPDSRWIAFFAGGKLRKIQVSGGPLQDICAANDARGGSWGSNGSILFTPKGRSSPIYRVAENGGEPVQITRFQEGISSHRWPSFLPDGKHFLYLASPVGTIHSNNQIRMASLDGKEDKLVLFASSNPQFANGSLLFVRDGTLMAAPMDARSGEVQGEGRFLPASVAFDPVFTSAAYSVSNNGMLLYQSGLAGAAELQWMSAAGKPLGKFGSAAVYGSLRVAPDDKRVAVNLVQGSGVDLWVLDVIRNVRARVTFTGRVPATTASWSPDGRSIAYSANVGTGKLQLFRKAADGTGEEQQVAAFSDRDEWLSDWSSDGRYLLFFALDPETRLDIWAVPADGSQNPVPVARGPHDEINGRFSPDGRWVAYVSNESGRNEIYLVPFLHGHGKWQVSTEGGIDIAWGRDGRTLYYTSGKDDMWAAPVKTRGDTVEIGKPLRIFSTPIRIIGNNGSFDVARDGRFLIKSPGETADLSMTLVQNWKALLDR